MSGTLYFPSRPIYQMVTVGESDHWRVADALLIVSAIICSMQVLDTALPDQRYSHAGA